MPTIALSLAFFAFSVLLHLCICRRSKVKDLKAKLFIIIGLAALAVFIFIAAWGRMPLAVTAAVLYIFLLPVYLTFYCSTELMSHSKRILQAVQESGEADYNGIFKVLEQENFIIKRLEELEQGGCVRRDGDRYILTPAGQAVARGLAFYQIFLGRNMGG